MSLCVQSPADKQMDDSPKTSATSPVYVSSHCQYIYIYVYISASSKNKTISRHMNDERDVCIALGRPGVICGIVVGSSLARASTPVPARNLNVSLPTNTCMYVHLFLSVRSPLVHKQRGRSIKEYVYIYVYVCIYVYRISTYMYYVRVSADVWEYCIYMHTCKLSHTTWRSAGSASLVLVPGSKPCCC